MRCTYRGSWLVPAILAVVIAAFSSTVSRADSVSYTIVGPSGPADCSFADKPGHFTVFATLQLSQPAMFLKVSTPELCGGAITWNLPVSGDPNTELTVDLGGCVSGNILLYSAEFDLGLCCPTLLTGPRNAAIFELEPPVLVGCGGAERYLIPPCSTGAPNTLMPADGAVVPTSLIVSWSHSFGLECAGGIGVPAFVVYYGTDPTNLDQSMAVNDTPQALLPGLTPETLYYWQVRVWDDYSIYTGTKTNVSPIQSFTTSDVVSAESTTWGHVKAMYRE